MRRIRVNLGERSYEILIGRNLLERCGREIASLGIGTEAVVIANRRVASLYAGRLARSLRRSGISCRFEYIPDSERAKSLGEAARLLGRISSIPSSTDMFVIALGGGVTGDLAGFVSAVYRRGIPYVQIPTTLLAQVDSAIGGKTAVDLPQAKNLVGAFHQPRIVISDVGLIRTLTPRDRRGALAEIIKYGVIADRRLFRFVEANLGRISGAEPGPTEKIIADCVRIKARLVEADERDVKGKRMALNFGHTIGHAIEAAASYSGLYSHGEAVAIGMVVATDIARSLGILGLSDAARIESLIRRSGLPVTVRPASLRRVYAAHLHDKKFSHGTNRFVLPSSIGAVRIVKDVPWRVIASALRKRSRSGASQGL
jgi:3-dehydroquinate synthase